MRFWAAWSSAAMRVVEETSWGCLIEKAGSTPCMRHFATGVPEGSWAVNGVICTARPLRNRPRIPCGEDGPRTVKHPHLELTLNAPSHWRNRDGSSGGHSPLCLAAS